MGILDDAIREHLELKKRRGASDEEVARQEAEALGPARREPAAAAATADETTALESAPSPPPDAETAVGPDAGAPPPPDPEPEVADTLHAEPTPLDPPPAAAEPVDEGPVDPFPATEAMPAAELPDPPADDEPVVLRGPGGSVPLGEPVVEEDEPAADPLDDATRVRPLPPVDDEALPPAPAVPTASDEPDDLAPIDDEATMVRPPADAPPPADPEADDVLEETPDFLQDTPDHDRLWFEQRPPRDFDFDD